MTESKKVNKNQIAIIKELTDSINKFPEIYWEIAKEVGNNGKMHTQEIINAIDKNINTIDLIVIMSTLSLVLEKKEDALTEEQRKRILKMLEEKKETKCTECRCPEGHWVGCPTLENPESD